MPSKTSKLPSRKRPQGQVLTPTELVAAKARFLKAYAETGIVTNGIIAAGVSWPTYMGWKERDEEFTAAFLIAQKEADDAIRREIHRRAIQGVQKPVFYQGVIVGAITEYSDYLLARLAMSKMPEFREKHQVEHTGSLTVIDLVRQAAEAVTAAEEHIGHGESQG